MPLYEYQCESCAIRFERIRKFSDPPLEICPSCGGTVKRLVSSPAFHFKGSGWYITDYAKKADTDKSAKAEGAGSDSDKSEAGKSDSSKSDTAKTDGSKATIESSGASSEKSSTTTNTAAKKD